MIDMLYSIIFFFSDFCFFGFVFLIIQIDMIRHYLPEKFKKAKKTLGIVSLILDLMVIPLFVFEIYVILDTYFGI